VTASIATSAGFTGSPAARDTVNGRLSDWNRTCSTPPCPSTVTSITCGLPGVP